jgi:hypothetical protein
MDSQTQDGVIVNRDNHIDQFLASSDGLVKLGDFNLATILQWNAVSFLVEYLLTSVFSACYLGYSLYVKFDQPEGPFVDKHNQRRKNFSVQAPCLSFQPFVGCDGLLLMHVQLLRDVSRRLLLAVICGDAWMLASWKR